MLEQFEAQQRAASEMQRVVTRQQQQSLIEVQPVLGHSAPSVSTEPLPSINTTFSRPASLRQVGRRTQLIAATRNTDALSDLTQIAFKSVHAQATTETSIPAARRTLQVSSLRLEVGSVSHPGIKRKDSPNEDSIFAIQGTQAHSVGSHPFGLFVVADGMGGHTNGQEASRLAIEAISSAVIPAVLGNATDDENLAELLTAGVHRANLALYRRSQQQALMGTTITAALVMGATAYVANVGDSRTYLYRRGVGLSQITRDHSVVARLVEEKMLQLDDIYTHPRRNEIYRCLGEHASVPVDTFTVPLQADDILLLCSDGLWEMVRDPDIRQILQYSRPYPSQASALLVQAALNRGGKDNVSVIVVHATQTCP